MRDDVDVGEVKTHKHIAKTEPDSKFVKLKPVLLPLNPSFLRLNADRGSDEFCDEFAVMLQNEEFLAELRFFKLKQGKRFIHELFYFFLSSDSIRNFCQPSTKSRDVTREILKKDWNTWERYQERSFISSPKYLHFRGKKLLPRSQKIRSFSNKKVKTSRRTEWLVLTFLRHQGPVVERVVRVDCIMKQLKIGESFKLRTDTQHRRPFVS